MSRARAVPLQLVPDLGAGAPGSAPRSGDVLVPVEPSSSPTVVDRWDRSPCPQLVLDPTATTVLATVAERLRATERPEAALARLAGDEFVVLDAMPAGGEGAVLEEVCQRVRAALAQPVVISGVEVVVSASTGVARSDDCGPLVLSAAPEERAEALLHRANAAMYAV